VYCFTFIHSPEDRFVHVMYLGINVATLCLLVGFVTGEIHKYAPISLTVSMSDGLRTGQILLYGSSGVFFLDQNTGEISLIGKESITKISGKR
jgi:hypothetical protein